MRIKLVLLLLILVVATLADNRKTADKDKALAEKEARKAKLDKHKPRIMRENEEEDDGGVQTMTMDEVEEDAGVDDEDYKNEDKEESEEKKKVQKSKSDKKSKPEKTSQSKKKELDDDERKPSKPTAPLRKSKKGKKVPITEELEETSYDDDTNEYQACSGTKMELCHCDQEMIDCSSITMEADDPKLRTADVAIQIKDFVPFTANFSDNGITRLHKNKVLPDFEKYVVILDMSFNQIRFMDSDVFKPFTNLTKLDLSHNNIQNVKKSVFEPIQDKLHRLDLGYNRLKTIPDNTFDGLTNLKTLILDGNPIKDWNKKMFKGLDNLEKLSLDACSIDELPSDIFEHLPKLAMLSIRENSIEEIPKAVLEAKTLKDLDMSLTNLTEIRTKAFAGDSDLEVIILEQMPFLSVVRDCGFCGLPKLKTLLLNDNKHLMEVHPNAFGFINSNAGEKAADIKEFSITNSNVTTISEHMMNYDKLASFKVGGNPWKCDCDTQFMLEEKFLYKDNSVAPTCASPANLNGRSLVAVTAVDACESARFLGRSGRFSSVLGLGLLCGFLIVGGYYAYATGQFKKLYQKVRKEPEVSYSNLQAAGEDYALETDFQPRPAEV